MVKCAGVDCGKTVYPMEAVTAEKVTFHKTCFKCAECKNRLTIDSYTTKANVFYCKKCTPKDKPLGAATTWETENAKLGEKLKKDAGLVGVKKVVITGDRGTQSGIDMATASAMATSQMNKDVYQQKSKVIQSTEKGTGAGIDVATAQAMKVTKDNAASRLQGDKIRSDKASGPADVPAAAAATSADEAAAAANVAATRGGDDDGDDDGAAAAAAAAADDADAAQAGGDADDAAAAGADDADAGGADAVDAVADELEAAIIEE